MKVKSLVSGFDLMTDKVNSILSESYDELLHDFELYFFTKRFLEIVEKERQKTGKGEKKKCKIQT